MALVTPPSALPLRSVKWRLLRPGQRTRSEWTGRSQGIILPGASRWQASGEFPPVARPDAANPWIAFFASLDGMMNSFYLRAVEAQQTTLANPTVGGAGQTGSTINVAGMSPGLAYVAAGARATIPLIDGTVQLVVLTAALTASVSGTATMSFKAPLRVAATNAGTVNIQLPYAQMALTTPNPGWDVGVGQIYGFTLDAEEAF